MHHAHYPEDPPEPPAHLVNDLQAQAEDELASTPDAVATWLCGELDIDSMRPVETMRIPERDIQTAPVRILLALIMTGTDQQANLARFFLRDRFVADHATEIDKRADELLIEAAKRAERDCDAPSWLLPSDAH